MKTIEATDTLVDELMTDWLDRDGDTFVHCTKKHRLGWEATLDSEDSYSDYFSESMTKRDIIKRAYSIAKDMLVVMDPPFKIYVRVSNHEGTGSTDGKYVYVSTKVFDDEELSIGARLDVFLGLVIHEGCHVLYTNFGVCSSIKSMVVKTIFNIIEDERIERLCGDLKPGLANFLEATKYYFMDKEYLDTRAGKESELSPFERLLNVFFEIIRYPKYLREEDVVEFAYYINEIKKVALPYPDTTKEAIVLAEKVFEIIKDLYVDEERERSESSESSDGSRGSSDDDIESAAMERLERDMEKALPKLSKLSKGTASAEASATGRPFALSSSEMSDEVSKERGLLGEELEGLVEEGSTKDTFFSKAPSAKDNYLSSLERVKRYIPAIARVMKGHCKEYKLVHRSMRSGVLDTNKLAEAIQGVPTIYIREGQVHTDKIAVCVLIDESGSMSGTRIRAARDAAVLLNEALSGLPSVELFIYGHSGDMRYSMATEMTVYRENGYAPKFALGSVEARSENRDGVAILETAKRVRKQTQSPVVMFVLSDGAPAAHSYSGPSAMEHVKQSVLKTENLGFSVIQVCIEHCYDPSKMFKNYVILDNMSTLAFELGKAIKKSAISMSKVHVS